MDGLTAPGIDTDRAGGDPEWLSQSLERAMASEFEREAVSCVSGHLVGLL